ncbi:phosphoglycerate dehydrogenase-like enzyme [Streptomyces sp. V4I23]|uniref:D-2-hydroxyacid dehydrogenase n=1 Tax=Streptomyces sp. V4I23 TaxID=3042282 RepID=UPI0027855C17|nr:D-2-hydroxyacid dehydrogenase [Streptomyces sp. V4I23]MDQ1010616.1 phosphoglycerate dehydrogenase-like enzyme [Streptomyces sp. V4I23]
MAEPTLLVLNADPPPRLGRLTGKVRVEYADEETLAARLRDADVLLVWDFASDAVRRAWPGEGPRPRWVHTPSAGVDRVLCPALAVSDTVVTNARGIFEQPIAEYVAALVLAMAKDLPVTLELQRRHEWRHREGLAVAGSRAVVVGAGPIGRAVAGALRALGATTAVVGRQARPGIHGEQDLDPLLARADWVVCAAPLTQTTAGMFDARRFGLMQPSARFVNVGRGPLVVEADLLDALHKRWIAGAALDVFESEPLAPDSPVWEAPGLIVSPHMSGDTIGWRDRLSEQFVGMYELWAAGEPLPNVVDKKRGYVPMHDHSPD